MSEPLHVWRLVTPKGDTLPAHRMRVPGGWLYTVYDFTNDVSVGLVFVPDASADEAAAGDGG